MSTYRDEREATLAQNAALQQQTTALEGENARLRQQNDSLLRENDSLRAAAGLSPRRRRAPWVFVAVAALVVLFVAGALAFFTVGSSTSEVAPIVVPTSAPPPMPPFPPPMPTPPPPPSMPAPPT
jgi:hypothetical protein